MKQRVKSLVEWKNLLLSRVYGSEKTVDFDETMNWLMEFGSRIIPMICDTTALMESAASAGKDILFEAQLGS